MRFSRLASITFTLAASLLANQTALSQDAFSADSMSRYPTANWPTHGGDLFNRQFSPLTQINRDNVANLKGVWHVTLEGSGTGPASSGEATPVVHDGIAYVITGDNDVFAISIETGDFLWVYEANLNPLISTVCCGWTSRGVGLGDGKVFVGQLDGKLKALDMATGEEVWSVQAEKWEEGYTITGAPLYYEGLVVTGFSGGERGTRGRIRAFDATD